MKDTAAIILAAGKGKRMKSKTPKVLHRIAGRTLVEFPIRLAQSLKCARIVTVVGHGRDEVEADIHQLAGGKEIRFAHQAEQLGTGHAAMTGVQKLRGHRGRVLILSGDVPLLDRASISRLAAAYKRTGGPLAFLTFEPDDPSGYGRVVREGKRAVAIREHRDCSQAERAIGEVNAGIYLIDFDFLRKASKKLGSDNSQNEFYLTDLVAMAAVKNAAAAVKVAPEIVGGINDRSELVAAERLLTERIANDLMKKGVTIRQPETVQIDVDVKVGQDTEIGPGVHLSGQTKIGRNCRIETGAVIVDSVIEDDALVKAYSVIEQAEVGVAAEVGPMGRLRPGTVLGPKSKVGNFVELKKTVLGPGSKANHLAYLGDGVIGERVNVGAGTIFCNYDGFGKHQTTLEDDVFIGSDSQLIAPVCVGKGAYVASGSTVTKDVPPDSLAIARGRQVNKEGVAPALKAMLKKRKARKGAKKK